MSNSGKKPTADDEVEQLLRAAQDDMLLKLSINSHMARASDSAAINPDLDRRFLALKKPQRPTQVNDSPIKAPTKKDNKVDGAAADDDLFARFAALKNSLPSHSGKENKSDESLDQQVIEEEDEEDEVEKIIKWAVDAARLDPSPPSESDDSGDDSLDEDDRKVDRGKKKNKRK